MKSSLRIGWVLHTKQVLFKRCNTTDIKETNMTIKTIMGAFFTMAGLVAMAGSAGDCDGKCGAGNDIGTMLFIIFWALVAMAMGAWMFIKGSEEG